MNHMADTTQLQELAAKILEQETSEEMVKLRQLIMLRAALEGDVKRTRIPAPMNITEVGGYYNLLVKQKQNTMLRQVVSSALGLPNDYAPERSEQVMMEILEELWKLNKKN